MFEIKNNLKEYRFDASPYSPNMIILNLLPAGKKVLDVGCASGYMAARLTKKGCQVYGIEIDREAARKAQRCCRKVVNANVEEVVKLPFSKGFFDVIIYGDILEHLRRPDLVLARFRKYLANGGIVIASIPNIARVENRLRLVLGKFDYQESGIMKEDHLRFFTLETARKMFQETGYKIQKILPTGLGARLRIFPTLFAFQFIVIAKKKL
jgi:2-polyprenyl-3-methyl-5-hydroxy-6-metoxy-1,4-benzoquinol methylase